MFPPIKWLLTRLAILRAQRIRRWFHGLTRRPRAVQHQRLFRQLRQHADTAFGRDHHFREIRNLADFRKHLPISRYEDYADYVNRVKAGELTAMFRREQVLMFAMTSGTTASRKYIPVTRQSLADYRRGWLVWGLHLFEQHRHLWFQPILQIVSDWQEEFTASGIPCGSISGLTTQMQPAMVRRTYVMPPASAKLKSTAAKYYLAWRLSLVRPLAIIFSANPSTMVNWARFGEQHAQQLIRDVHDGTVDPAFQIPEAIQAEQKLRLQPNPERAWALTKILESTGRFQPREVWPSLNLLGNWTGGSVASYMRYYPEYYGTPIVRDLGLVASEGRMTIPIADFTAGGILDIMSGFYEFIPVAEADSAQPTVLEAHELQPGQEYYILLTTAGGLYRYNIYDVVRCEGWHQQTPILTFLNKGSYFSNLTGEKISEHQVVAAVAAVLAQLDLRLAGFTLAPCWADPNPYYGLFVEMGDFPNQAAAQEFERRVELELSHRNTEYETKRQSQRLAPLQLHFLPAGFWVEWDRQRLQKTRGSAEQYKHPCLIPDPQFKDSLPILVNPWSN